MLFSQRYLRALEQKTLHVDISEPARRKLWAWLLANDPPRYVKRDPNDNWISNSSAIEEAESALLTEEGWDHIPGVPERKNGEHLHAMRHLLMHGDAPFVFDALELIAHEMDATEKETLRQKANQIFELHDCPWRISDGEFFKLDADFVGARLASTAHDALAANHFAGAANEYAKARQYLGSGEVKEAIYYAGHSFESVMKVLTKLDHANADKLIKELGATGYFDDLPENVRAGFADQVLKTLPFLRNKLGGHGQGASVVSIPPVYADLAIQLAAVLHNFLIAKHLERAPPLPPPPSPEVKAAPSWMDDDIPF